jgi:hypothetical protein
LIVEEEKMPQKAPIGKMSVQTFLRHNQGVGDLLEFFSSLLGKPCRKVQERETGPKEPFHTQLR